MSVYEKPRREKNKEVEKTEESAENTNEWLDNLDIDQVKPKEKTVSETKVKEQIKIVIQEEALIEQVEIVTAEMRFTEVIPSWTSKPWMYIQPTVEGQLSSWHDSWMNLILDYSRIFTVHVINVNDLLKTHPFTNKKSSKSLTQPVITKLVDAMVLKNLAKWLDSSKILIRVYYKTDQQWAELIIDFLVEKGYAAEVMTLFELENLNQEWSSIPREELRIIFDILVAENRAKWVDESKESLTFSL